LLLTVRAKQLLPQHCHPVLFDMLFKDVEDDAEDEENDENDDLDEDDEDKVVVAVTDPAQLLMQRGAYLRQLREMERQDEEERQRTEVTSLAAGGRLKENEDDEKNNSRTYTTDEFIELASGDRMLLYESYLSHQRYYDDLKHVDYRYIDFGDIEILSLDDDHNDITVANTIVPAASTSRLVIEQCKGLGKGGLVWDAAFILGNYVIELARNDDWWLSSSKTTRSVVELGCGTGICGMMIAKAIPNLEVHLTDLPELMPLLTRNVQRNFIHILDDSIQPNEQEGWSSHEVDLHSGKASQSPVAAQVLDWAKVEAGIADDTAPTYDVILGADVVASLYDPVALARTIHALARADSIVYLTFKERLSTIHRQFENEIDNLFGEWNIFSPPPHSRRNHNPDVRIIRMRFPIGKK